MNAPIHAARMAVPGPGLHLRVLNSRLAGAEHRLPLGRAVRVGHSFQNDVVLRGANTQGLSLELHVDAEAAMLRVLTGSVVVLGRAVQAGEAVILPPYLPVRLGEYAFAVGADDDARWAEAERLADTVAQRVPAAAGHPRADLGQRLATRFDPVATRLGGVLPRRRALALIAAAALAIAGIAAGIVRFALPDPNSPAAVERALADNGFSGLKARRDAASGNVLIGGTVRDDGAADRLRGFAARRFPAALVEVETTSGMAAVATDVLRTNHVDAQARVVQAGVLEVETQYLPGDRQAELTGLLKRDIPALRTVRYRMLATRGADELRYFFNSPQYGAASFVDGNPGYIVTADGSRWFAGAVLPTGHRIVAVGGGEVTLERAGQIEKLVM